MSDSSDRTIPQQIAWESARRTRLWPLAAVGGVLYVLASTTLQAELRGEPTVGLVQGLTPALTGVAYPTVSPRTAELRFISHHAFGTIVGSLMQSIAVVLAAFVLSFLCDAAIYRRPASLRAARGFVLVGGLVSGALIILRPVIQAIMTHHFAVGHNLSNQAADHALITNTPTELLDYVDLVMALCFAIGVGTISLNAMRVGLLTRLMGWLGIVVAMLFVVQIATLSVVTAFWLVALGILFLGRWPSGDPPAWATGEARPWPSQAEMRAARAGSGGDAPPPRAPNRGGLLGRAFGGAAAAATSPAQLEAPPEPVVPQQAGSGKRKRRRGR